MITKNPAGTDVVYGLACLYFGQSVAVVQTSISQGLRGCQLDEIAGLYCSVGCIIDIGSAKLKPITCRQIGSVGQLGSAREG